MKVNGTMASRRASAHGDMASTDQRMSVSGSVGNQMATESTLHARMHALGPSTRVSGVMVSNTDLVVSSIERVEMCMLADSNSANPMERVNTYGSQEQFTKEVSSTVSRVASADGRKAWVMERIASQVTTKTTRETAMEAFTGV